MLRLKVSAVVGNNDLVLLSPEVLLMKEFFQTVTQKLWSIAGGNDDGEMD